MQISFLRVGAFGQDSKVGFLCNKDGSLAAFKDANEALEAVDYSGSDPVSAVLHHLMFDPVAYVFKGSDDNEVLDILRKGLSQGGKLMKMSLHNITGTTTVIAFPNGQDPFPDAVKVEKQL